MGDIDQIWRAKYIDSLCNVLLNEIIIILNHMKQFERTIEAFVAQIYDIIMMDVRPEKTEYCTSRDISINFSIDKRVLLTIFPLLVLSETATIFLCVVRFDV